LRLLIDIAKATAEVAAWDGHPYRRHTFAQTSAGHVALLAWLRRLGEPVARVCLEATGTYGDDLAQAVHEAGYRVSLLNPAVLKAFRHGTLTRTKNDRTDAARLARYGAVHQPEPWTPPAPAFRELQALVRRWESVQQMRQQELNRRESARAAAAYGGLTPRNTLPAVWCTASPACPRPARPACASCSTFPRLWPNTRIPLGAPFATNFWPAASTP
jgi:transposase